jgi:hypothetical protein
MIFGSISSSAAEETAHFERLGRTFSTSKNLEIDEWQARVKTAPPRDRQLIEDLEENYNTLPPLFLFHLAERKFRYDPDAAIEWYWMGMVRSRLDAVLCADTSAAQGVSYLPGIARSVAVEISKHPEVAGRIGQKVLAREDLKASRASPWWICVHGIKAYSGAMRQWLKKSMTKEEQEASGLSFDVPEETPLGWLKPEEEVVPIYENILSGAKRTFDEMASPSPEPTPLAKQQLSLSEINKDKRYDSLLWHNDGGLVYLQPQQDFGEAFLWYWREDRPAKLLTPNAMTSGLCVGNGKIYAPLKVHKRAHKSDSLRLEYSIDTLSGWNDAARYPELLQTETEPHPAFQQARYFPANSQRSYDWRQSQFTCKWLPKPDFGELDESISKWSDLGPFPGHLVILKGADRANSGTFYLPPEGAPQQIHPLPLPISCMRYVAHRHAVLVNACKTAYRNRRGQMTNEHLKARFWLSLENDKAILDIEDFTLLNDETGDTVAVDSAIGMLRIVTKRRSGAVERPGGIYLYKTPEGPIEKIWEGWPDNVDIGPKGCKIAISDIQHPGGERNKTKLRRLLVGDLCVYAQNHP